MNEGDICLETYELSECNWIQFFGPLTIRYMLYYLYETIIYKYTCFTMNRSEWIFMTTMLAYWLISVSSFTSIYIEGIKYMNIVDNYAGILVSTVFLSNNDFILKI